MSDGPTRPRQSSLEAKVEAMMSTPKKGTRIPTTSPYLNSTRNSLEKTPVLTMMDEGGNRRVVDHLEQHPDSARKKNMNHDPYFTVIPL